MASNHLSLVTAPIAIVDSIDCEETVVSFLLRNAKDNPEATDPIFKLLSPGDFGELPYKLAFETMKRLGNDGVIIERASLKIALESAGHLRDVGGVAALNHWGGGGVFAHEISAESAAAMAYQVLERSRRRIAIEAGQALIKIAQDYTKSLPEMLALVEKSLVSVATNATAEQGEDLGNLALTALTEIEARCSAVADNRTIGIRSGLADLDKAIGGYRPGELIVIAGRPGMGKSALAMNEVVSIAKQGLPVLMFSLEMVGTELATRVMGGEARVDLTLIRDGKVSPTEREKLIAAVGLCQDLPIRVYTQAQINMGAIASIARRSKARAVDNRLGGIFVDYLQLLEYDRGMEAAELGKITSSAKRLAMELECPVFVLSQLNRAVEGRQDKRPTAADLKSSGSIEQDASLILMVYRDVVYNPDTPDRDIAEIGIVKQRNGAAGVAVKVVYDASTTTFRNLARRF
jgi:replicative DNA helicase